jgi:hypothetical protein
MKEKMGHGEKRSRKQDLALVALLNSPTIGEAAKVVGIGETTLWRWLQDEDFQERYRDAKRRAVNQAVTRLQQATTVAVDTLEEVMQNPGAPPSSRVAAAKTVLEMAFKALELDDYAERLERLEEAMAVAGANGK